MERVAQAAERQKEHRARLGRRAAKGEAIGVRIAPAEDAKAAGRPRERALMNRLERAELPSTRGLPQIDPEAPDPREPRPVVAKGDRPDRTVLILGLAPDL